MTPKQSLVLRAIAEWEPRDGRTHPDHIDIAWHCGRGNASDWAHTAIRSLLSDGMIEVVRVHRGARTYRITQRGAEALTEQGADA
jgi:predicted transcriptional regulator